MWAEFNVGDEDDDVDGANGGTGGAWDADARGVFLSEAISGLETQCPRKNKLNSVKINWNKNIELHIIISKY